ncbi:hypothetical protein ABZP36_034041 [Zizania latifolia]
MKSAWMVELVWMVKKANPKELNPYLRDNGSGYPDESGPSNAGNPLLASSVVGNPLLASSVVGDGGASWRLNALKRAKEQAAQEGKKLEEAEKLGKQTAQKNMPKEIKRRVSQVETVATGNCEYLRDVSSRHRVMRKPKPDSAPWKRNRQNISSEDQALVSSAIAGINKFSNDGRFLEKISNLESENANVSNGEVDELKSDKDSSMKAPSQQRFHLQMKGKHEEADKHSVKMEAVLENQDSAVEEPSHEMRSSIRHTIKSSAADHGKREEDADLHLANKIMHNKQYDISRSLEDEYDSGDAPSKKGKRRNKEAHEDKRRTQRHFLTQKERCFYCFENPSRPKHLVVAIGNFTYLMLPQYEPVVPGHCIILPLQHESARRTVDRNLVSTEINFSVVPASNVRSVLTSSTANSMASRAARPMVGS